jgi:LPS export ABC transporter protein LptC
MANRQLWLAILFIVIAILAVIVLAISLQQPPDSAVQPSPNPTNTPNSDVFLGTTIKIRGAGQNGLWELKVLELERTDNIELLTDVKGVYYENGILLYRITAQRGQIFVNSRILKMSNTVKFESSDGKKIFADELTWDPNGERIQARGRVRFESARSVLTTDELSADLRLNRVNLSGKTQASYQR